MENNLIKLKIQKERRNRGFTQESMAQALGISTNSYCQIESGKTLLVSTRVFEIANILNLSPEELLLGSTSSIENDSRIAELEKNYRERIIQIETETKISIVELEAEIQRLKAALESKESIIGVLKESLNRYSK